MPALSPFPPGPVLAGLLAALLALPSPAASAPAAAAQQDDVLAATLSGEYALQAGRLGEAADWYLRAARAADGDPALAERAARIALLANDDDLAGDAIRLWKRHAPDSLAMRSAQATWLLRGGRERAARRELEKLLRDPDPDGWRHALAALGSGTRDPAASAQVLGRLVASGAIPDQLQAWLAFGGLAQRFGEPGLAEGIVAEVVERFPDEPRVALLRASQLREAGDADGARAALAAIERQAEVSPELRLAIAAEYDSLGDPSASARIMALGPQDERSYGLRATLLVKAEDRDALAALYAELRDGAGQPDPAGRLLLGQIAEYLERHDDALEWYRSVPGGPQREVARLRATKALHDLGRAEEAYAELRALQTDADVDERLRRDAYLMEAELRAADDDAEGEREAFARGLAAHPDEGALLYARALMWERRDDIPRAEADLRRVLVAEPENVAALNALGYTLADRTNRYAEALELIDRARVAEPDNAAIVDSYGWVLYRLGRHEEALAELLRAWRLMKDPEIGAHIGEVLWTLGRRDEAREYFQKARELDPDNRSLLRALRKTGAEA
ncbi:tetratricopeptide repeat protein [Luteimonas sp. RD2P54]|uniref:Tetratricopeptide repeat protein n=1 Tax=Luteimonas endophytica TaxID=3042023 RepID=A0ABT6J6B2_9GAMM|nr:tetratricopeptide repeat protein [Luteimonas endophytica]MDH5822125.1 tetratricopeptide repeat protein [Luteimonas endophytica]